MTRKNEEDAGGQLGVLYEAMRQLIHTYAMKSENPMSSTTIRVPALPGRTRRTLQWKGAMSAAPTEMEAKAPQVLPGTNTNNRPTIEVIAPAKNRIKTGSGTDTPGAKGIFFM